MDTFAENDGSILPSKIDWENATFADFVLGDTSITINKSYPFKLLVIGAGSSWGYSGAEFGCTIDIQPSGEGKTIYFNKGIGGDNIARALVAMASCRCLANTDYKISINVGDKHGHSPIVGLIFRAG